MMPATPLGVILHTGADAGANLTIPEFAALVVGLGAFALGARWFFRRRAGKGAP